MLIEYYLNNFIIIFSFYKRKKSLKFVRKKKKKKTSEQILIFKAVKTNFKLDKCKQEALSQVDKFIFNDIIDESNIYE